ncbi:MAG: helix-turn-helix domain-containing protein [Acidimicrobiales bacterium]
MAERPRVWLGSRIKELRQERQLNQQALANILKRSVSWVSQVERGEIEVTDVSMLQRLAAALGVPSRELVEVVLGEEAGEAERKRPYVEALRVTLAGHPAPQSVVGRAKDRSATSAAASLDRLAVQAQWAWAYVHASEYDKLGPLLAGLIPELEVASRLGGDQDTQRAALALLADAYQVAAAMLIKAGDAGAGWIAADRAIAAGERCGDRCLVMAGQYRMAHTFLDSSERELALHVLRQAVGVASELTPEAEPGLVSLTGACALLLAVVEARGGDAEAARRHLRVAEGLARHLGADRNDYDTEFGPTNVALHRVAVAVELGNAGQALELAAAVDPSGLSPERQARFLVDVARAHVQRRGLRQAVAALEQAEAVAPGEIKELPRVRDLVADLEHFAGQRRIPGLRPLRQRITRN